MLGKIVLGIVGLIIGVLGEAGRGEIATRENQQVSILVTGDVMPGRMVDLKIRNNGNSDFIFENVREWFLKEDIVVVNLEAPLITNCPITRDGFKFCGQISFADAMVRAGIDGVNMDNNHIFNYGLRGSEETKEVLTRAGIKYFGLGQVWTTEVRGIKFAFLGINDVPAVNEGGLNNFIELVQKYDREVDHVVVQFHWGVEYSDKATKRQKQLASRVIGAGADLVVGNHAHWVQEVEKIDGKLVAYGHGNFVFDQQWSLKTQEGVVGKYVFDNEKLVEYELVPIIIDGSFQPRLKNRVQ